MQDFQKLKVWEKAHILTIDVYKITRSFPKEEMYGLTSQIRRASASIGANIAEGCVKGSDAEFGRFLIMALGSASELQYHILLAKDLNFITIPDYENLDAKANEIMKMLTVLIKKLKANG